MVKVNIFVNEFHRLCSMQMALMELLSSEIITMDDYNKYKSVIKDRLKVIEREVKNGKNEKNAECCKQNIISKECK